MSKKGRMASAYNPAAAADGYGGVSSWRQMQNLMQGGRQRLFGVIGAASGPESDVTIGPHQHCPFRPEFTLLGPGTARIDVVAVEDADTNRDQIDTALLPELLGRVDPWRTIFAGNQDELAVVNEGVE